MTGSSVRLPGVGKSLSGQHRARVLHKKLSCNICSRRSESSSHQKAPVVSVCPRQGSGSRKTETSKGLPSPTHQAPCQVYARHSLVSLSRQPKQMCHQPSQQQRLSKREPA